MTTLARARREPLDLMNPKMTAVRIHRLRGRTHAVRLRPPSVEPRMIPLRRKFAELLRRMYGLTIAEAKALLPVSYSGDGSGRRYYLIVRRVDRFLESEMPTL
ncbi:MAG TPA: hypothetical protein VNG73_11070 [Gemmatimonadaceae bacterium]|nr:hypothetical protein [Gemmatimonadaceae bacterium]